MWKERIDERWGGVTIYCSYCKEKALLEYKDGLYRQVTSNFCPNCGALSKVEQKQNVDEKCKTCKYYFYAFEGFPCIHCQRNFELVDEIREQKNDLWKDGASK